MTEAHGPPWRMNSKRPTMEKVLFRVTTTYLLGPVMGPGEGPPQMIEWMDMQEPSGEDNAPGVLVPA